MTKAKEFVETLRRHQHDKIDKGRTYHSISEFLYQQEQYICLTQISISQINTNKKQINRQQDTMIKRFQVIFSSLVLVSHSFNSANLF